MQNVVITATVRSPIGTFGGALKNITPVELVVPVLQEAVKQGGVEPHEVDEVILGHCIQRTDEANTARTAALAKQDFQKQLQAIRFSVNVLQGCKRLCLRQCKFS